MSDEKTTPLMKDGIGPDAIDRMAASLNGSWADFPHDAFRRDALQGLDTLELKQRVQHLIVVLRRHLPRNVPEALEILQRAPDHWQPGKPGDSMASFAAWPLIDFVGEHGLDCFEASMQTLHRLTALFSAEFAIRPFLEQQPERTLDVLTAWTRDDDHHVRRLVSEGTRPRLPWGRRLRRFQDDPSEGLALLEVLKDDPSEYVRRSVANHLNDIAKDHPQRIVHVCTAWKEGASQERRWILRHGLRSLVKAGDAGALRVLGYDADADVAVQGLRITPTQIELGESVTLTFELTSQQSEPAPLVVDYAIHHVKANGSTSVKVFKLKNITLDAGERLTVTKKHGFRKITTRAYYSGRHQVDILLNGQCRASAEVWLEVPG